MGKASADVIGANAEGVRVCCGAWGCKSIGSVMGGPRVFELKWSKGGLSIGVRCGMGWMCVVGFGGKRV